jgi:hypothetical protein
VIKAVVNQFDRDSSISIRECQELLKKDSLSSSLAFISCHLSFLPAAITMLEEAGLPLADALKIVENAKMKINSIPGSTGRLLQEKLFSVLEKNPGLSVLGTVAEVLEGRGDALPESIGPADAAQLKFCPTASVDVERSFSMYKNILSDRRHSLTEENLSKIMICHYYYNR